MIEVDWILFFIASTAVICMPGQDLILVMSRSITQGPVAGMYTAAGVSGGLLVHTLLAGIGVGAVVTASELLFNSMKWVGAIYLLYLGVMLFRTKAQEIQVSTDAKRGYSKLVMDGAFSNVANPKIAIFFLAFLPQFVNTTASSPTLSILVLGLGFALLTFVIKGAVAYFSGQLSAWFRKQPRYLTRIHQLSGLTLIALGLKLAFEQRP